ncbi:nose resistant to fluoxetine protein 6-like [Leguminivora glycinivorella]|uniref:nose resistant to fluoxetine protein 6-like n=1 Tax=Leguminivora glycinivorella TaxID=1035111 RepID=UPI00200BF2A6|nr:nose resistant to fluoxetine protein 6-like [Leguminivora glycinivorella]
MQYLLILLFLVHQSSGIIYSLNLTEYYKFPELYQMDDYDPCVTKPGGLYCLMDADLYPGENTELMGTLREYSEYRIKHFNHTQVHRALCVTKTCKDFIHDRNLEIEEDLKLTLEECLNASLWSEYKLTARLTNILSCKKHGEKRYFDIGDYIMAAVYIVLIILNVLGTVHDELKGKTTGIPFLLAFSLRKNWRRLTAPSSAISDHRLRRLKVIDSLRSLTIFGVFSTHTALAISFSYIKNPYYFETAYDDIKKLLLITGPVVTYTFFMMSGFLVAFNVELQAEKRKITLWDWPKGVLLRYLRLTPCLALVMFTIMTVNRHFGDGPQWDVVVTGESRACNQYWWAHLLYINNYIYDDSQCLPQGWYLAADTQLFALGLLVCVLCRQPRSQLLVIGSLAVISLVIPAAYTYIQDYDAIAYQSPELFRTVYKNYDTFRTMYIGAHTNLSTYVVGLAGGLLTFRWLKNEKESSNMFKRHRWVIWLLVPSGFSCVYSSGFLYIDGYQPSMTTKVLVATIRKPAMQLINVTILMGCVFKAENIVRGLLEWRGFTWIARVSYSAFLIHTIIQRGMIGTQRLPTYASDIYMVMILAGTAFLSLAGAVLLWLMVEAPLATVVKNIFVPARREPVREEITEETTKV